jgi:hypothetical protein
MNHLVVGIGSIITAGVTATAGWTWYYLNHCVRHPDLEGDDSSDEEIDGIPINVPVRRRDRLRAWLHLSLKEDRVPDMKLLIYSGNQRNWKRVLHPLKDLKGLQEKILGPAIRHPDGLIYGVGYGGRHHHCIRYMHSLGKAGMANTHDQGFVTTSGRYVDRIEGLAIAQAGRQIVKKTNPATKLFSEDLW